LKWNDNLLCYCEDMKEEIMTGHQKAGGRGALLAVGVIVLSLQGRIYAQSANSVKTVTDVTNSSGTIILEGKSLTLEETIDMVLENNLSSKSIRYDAVMSDSDYLKYQKIYTPAVNAQTIYSNGYNASLSLSKAFNTGTSISLGVLDSYSTNQFSFAVPQAMMSMMGIGTENTFYHSLTGFVTIQQQLLQNAFGYSERLQSEILEGSKNSRKAGAEKNLADLVTSAISDCWNLSILKSAVQNAELELSSVRQVRDIIAKNVQYGLGESYDLNQYNAAVATAENKLAKARQSYQHSVRSLLRELNLPADSKIEGELTLSEDLPWIDTNEAMQKAFSKRVDYNNALIALDSARESRDMYRNSSLPSLALSVSAGSYGTNTEFGQAASDAAALKNPFLYVGLTLSYPLGDPESEINVRNADLKLKQAEDDLKQKNMEIRDEILDDVDQVVLKHTSLSNLQTALAESELYYDKMLNKFRQGKINATTLKIGFDDLISVRQDKLSALIEYNIALLQFDVSKNELFEKYGVDVEKYLNNIEE